MPHSPPASTANAGFAEGGGVTTLPELSEYFEPGFPYFQ